MTEHYPHILHWGKGRTNCGTITPRYYSAAKGNKPLIYTVRVDPKGFVRMEKGQSQKLTYYMAPFIQHSLNDKITERGRAQRGAWM